MTEKHPNGNWDFTRIHPRRALEAHQQNVCWICGGIFTGNVRAFIAGPLSLMTCTVAEPPMHLDCARFAVETCPFMVHPEYVRTFHGMQPGFGLDRNPGVSVIMVVTSYKFAHTDQGILYKLSVIRTAEFFTRGRRSTHEELETSIEDGLPRLLPLLRSKHDVHNIVMMALGVWGYYLGHYPPGADDLRRKYLELLASAAR